jgi:hypothetical protein
MYIRRHCYDKPWRCPGWAGGGWRYPKTKLCDGGTLDFRIEVDGAWPRWHSWHWHRCPKCEVLVIPMVTRWADPSWLWFKACRMPGAVADRWDLRRERRARRARRRARVDAARWRD